MVKLLSEYKAIIFDLDDTLIDRDNAVDVMFTVIIKKCYSCVPSDKMLIDFKIYDNNGYSNKTIVLNTLFDKYPPDYRIPSSEIRDFWDTNFPNCFSINPERLSALKIIVENTNTAIITNGATQVQKAKIEKTGLDKIFDMVIISDEVGVSKPDPKIFNIALQNLNIKPEEALFVGDNLENDINGCQKAGLKGIWFNPNNLKNDTDIIPFKEINTFNQILSFVR